MLRISIISFLLSLSFQSLSQDYVRSGLDSRSVEITRPDVDSMTLDSITLIVVDGLEYEGELSDIPVDEIESSSLLKDASTVFLCHSPVAILLIVLKKSDKSTEERFLDWKGVGQASTRKGLKSNV